MLMRIQCCHPRIKTHASATGMVGHACGGSYWLCAFRAAAGGVSMLGEWKFRLPSHAIYVLSVWYTLCLHDMRVCMYVCMYVCIYIYIFYVCVQIIYREKRERERKRDYLPHLSDLLACSMIDYKCIRICNTNDNRIQIYMDMSMTDMAQNILRNGMVWC